MSKAVVIGASMTGLLAGRVLAESFENVTVLDSDNLPDQPQSRPGVPQARHLHALLPRGLEILERLFPGIKAELMAEGAQALDVANDIAWLTPQGWGVRCPSGFDGLAFTRDLLDWVVGRRVRQLPNVEILGQYTVQGLTGNARRVEGIKVRHDASTPPRGALESDLVVVATGRHSSTPRWLEELGLQIERSQVNAHIGYASRMLRRPEISVRDWKAIFVQAAPPDAIRGGILFPVEGGRWLVTLQGGDWDYPPTDEAGFLDFARSLRSRALFDAIKDAEPLTDIRSYRTTENQWRHYERLFEWPERLIVLGDAACAFNPVYGQGITTASLAAEALRAYLDRRRGNLEGLSRNFQKQLARINSAPWMLATMEDMRFRSVEGAKPSFGTKLMHNYVDRVLRVGTKVAKVRTQFLEVQGMLKSPQALFRPSILMRVVEQATFGSFSMFPIPPDLSSAEEISE